MSRSDLPSTPPDDPDHVDRIADQWARERPDLDVSGMHVIGRLHRLGERLSEELRVVYSRFGIGEGEFDVLCALRRAGAPFQLTAGGIAATTMVTSGAVTKRIDRLEALGLVVREVCADDARTRQIRLTPAGVERIDEAFAAHMANERRLLAGLPPQDRAELARILRAWGNALD